MTVLAHSLDGQLRIREIPRRFGGNRFVAELHIGGGDWTWCVWPHCEEEQAWSLFMTQAGFHTGPHPWIEAYYHALDIMATLDLEPTSVLRDVAHELLGLPWGEKVGEFVVYGIRRIESC